MREVAKEKERLQRYFMSKERAQKQIEALEKRGQDLLMKKEKKLAKIEERIRKETKELKKQLQEKEVNRHQKKKHVEDSLREHLEHSEEIYHKHLEDVKAGQEEKLRKQREWCEQEYKRHHESMSKSLNHYRQALKERQELEVVTERNLQEVNRRLSLGWARSQAFKEELRSHAAETLSNFRGVCEHHERIENDMQKERLAKFLTRRDKQQKYFNKWEK